MTDGIGFLIRVVAVIIGPAAALLHEFGLVSPGPAATLWPILSVVLAAATGVLVGLAVVRRESRRLWWLVVVSNGIVLMFYGFLLLFFGLGGSR